MGIFGNLFRKIQETGEPWYPDVAIALCIQIEDICPEYGCHVALTGGVLYKPQPRKDLDLVFYRIRQVERIDVDGLFTALEKIGITRVTEDEAWCIKARYGGRSIDCLFPENTGGSQRYGANDDKKGK